MRFLHLTFGNIFRSKIRSFLTILGVAIGIYTIVVMGSLAEYLNDMVASAKVYMGGVVHVVTKTDKKGQNPGVSKEIVQKIRNLEEVKSISPFLILLMDGFDLEKRPLTFLSPQFTVGAIQDLYILKSGRQGIHLKKGRWLKKKDDFQALINLRVAKKRNLSVGKTMLIRKRKYTVVGIIDLPNIPAAPDAFIPYHRLKSDFQKPNIEFAKKMLQKAIPKGSFPLLNFDDMAKEMVGGLHGRYYPYYIIPKKGVSIDLLVKKVRKVAPQVAVIPPKQVLAEVEHAMMLFTLIMLCIGLLSSVVATLLIINTLVMSILERKKEIGIKMAIGASKNQIILEFISESFLIGLIGGVIGIAGGSATVLLVNPWVIDLMETGQSLFILTPRLIVGSFIFSLVLSCMAGLYPAYRAATLNPVETLRNL